MDKSTKKGNVQQWVCRKLAAYYQQPLKPSDLLALKQVQRDVVVIGPDGRKFRLQDAPTQSTTDTEPEMEKSK
ncbi:MAG: hypothetical protein JEZ00_07715 [Anaerolineaceae bacterium]|nr:hypothetical protein [Anaerolineaceae bacterium]